MRLRPRHALPYSILLLTPLLLSAQVRSTNGGGFTDGQTVIGGVVGFGNLNGATASVGGRYEHAFKSLPNLAHGVLGFAVDVDYYHFSDGTVNEKEQSIAFTYIPIGATINYHVHLDNPQWDPFLGAGLGYSIASVSGLGSTTASSGLYVITRLGVRYFLVPKIAIQADAGAGAASLSLGIVWKM